MSEIDNVLHANELYAASFTGENIPNRPARHLAVVACMDYRIMIQDVLGLKIGDAIVIRNAGGIITEDALRSLIVATYLLGVEEIMVINHTECGMLRFTDQELLERLRQQTGTATVAPSHFYAFTDLHENVLLQVQRVKQHAWIPPQTLVRGFIYDVHTGKLTEAFPINEVSAGTQPGVDLGHS